MMAITTRNVLWLLGQQCGGVFTWRLLADETLLVLALGGLALYY